jgi:hypothetical protein
MSESYFPAPFSSAASPAPDSVSLFAKYKAKLAPFRDAAIGYVEGLQLVADQAISGTAPRKMDDLELHDFYWETENDTSFHAVSHKKKDANDEEIWSDELEDDLRLPALFTSNCSKVVYCLLQQVREVLADDPDFDKAVWSREYIDPELILFDVDENGKQRKNPLPFLAHDFIVIHGKGKANQRFVLDVTGDQFGIREWFHTKKDYWELLLEGRFPNAANEATKVAELEAEDPRNPAVKSAVEQGLDETKADWAREHIRWRDIHLLPEWKQSQLRQGVADKVRTKVVAALNG